MTTKNTKFGKLGLADWVKAAILTVTSTAIASIATIINTGVVPTAHDLKIIGLAGACTLASYLTKNTLTNSEGKLLKRESKAKKNALPDK